MVCDHASVASTWLRFSVTSSVCCYTCKMDSCWLLSSNVDTRFSNHIAIVVLHHRFSIATCVVCSCRSPAKAVQVARLSYISTQAELSNDLRAMEAMPLTCLAVCGRMCIADRQVKVTDAGPAVRCWHRRSLGRRCVAGVPECRQGSGYTAIAPSQKYGRAKATALLDCLQPQ